MYFLFAEQILLMAVNRTNLFIFCVQLQFLSKQPLRTVQSGCSKTDCTICSGDTCQFLSMQLIKYPCIQLHLFIPCGCYFLTVCLRKIHRCSLPKIHCRSVATGKRTTTQPNSFERHESFFSLYSASFCPLQCMFHYFSNSTL